MKFTTFIPTHLNDGAPVPESELDAIQMELFVKCDNNRVEEVQETVKSIGRMLGQKAMWIEFDFSDNAQVIDCES